MEILAKTTIVYIATPAVLSGNQEVGAMMRLENSLL